MKYLIVLLALVVLVSGCVEFPFAQTASFSVGTMSATTNDMGISAEANPKEVHSGRTTLINFIVNNLQSTDINNVAIDVYDRCLFTGEGDVKKTIETIAPNRSSSWKATLTLKDVTEERDCELKFKTTYDSQFSLSKQIIVLSESEYTQREHSNTLNELSAGESSTRNSLKITTSMSKDQPLLAGAKVYLYIDYSYLGPGIIDTLGAGSIIIVPAKNMKNFNCNNFEKTVDLNGEHYASDKDMEFVDKKLPRTTCEFIADTTAPIDTSTLTLTADYTYQLDYPLVIKALPE